MLNGECIDLDECNDGHFSCDENFVGRNNFGGFTCICKYGYEVNDGKCSDIDDCEKRICPENSTCENTEGSFTCRCKEGFEGETCQDIDECSTNADNCDKGAECLNTGGSYKCHCKTGYYGTGEFCLEGKCQGRGQVILKYH